MRDFVIVAGTMLSDQSVPELRQSLHDMGLACSEYPEHIRLVDCYSFEFRRGFGHEYQIVGDADTLEKLLEDAAMVSTRLTDHRVEHSFEVYDIQGEIAGEFNYP